MVEVIKSTSIDLGVGARVTAILSAREYRPSCLAFGVIIIGTEPRASIALLVIQRHINGPAASYYVGAVSHVPSPFGAV